MEASTKTRKYYNPYDRKTIIIFGMFIFTLISLPTNVKCDMTDNIASLLLFMLISIFICAGIGWWSRRSENK